MNQEAFYKKLCEINGAGSVFEHEPMRRHTTFRIGGPARYFCTPGDTVVLKSTIEACKEAEIPFYILGNGSNVLVSDRGYNGVIVQICRNMAGIDIKGGLIEADAGILLSRLSQQAASKGLTGLEFASGIPGTLGGALVMNAGAYGGEIKDVLVSVSVLDRNGGILRLDRRQMKLGYRTSAVQKEGYVVLGALLELKEGDAAAINSRMRELKTARSLKQPLEYPSAGSTFKRPEGQFAGKLIMDAGLAGYRIGGAEVSRKHCGFIINVGGATAEDVMDLAAHVRDTVFSQTGVSLEMEIKTLGF